MNFLQRIFGRRSEQVLPGEDKKTTTESGRRSSVESQVRAIYNDLWVDPRLRAAILEIRSMDRLDGRVKKIHRVSARAGAKGGLMLEAPSSERRLHRAFLAFRQRLGLDRREKLESDLRGLMMEGNLPLQWVLDDQQRVVAAVRMPTETLIPQVDVTGRFKDPAEAYHQVDALAGQQVIARFALWQLTVARLDPDSYDDWGSYGRPYLDSTRTVWKKLNMTEEDLVVRRRMRAPLRLLHVLEGADDPDLDKYRKRAEEDQAFGNHRDFFMNRKGAVTPIQGDANLDQIADVGHLLDTFFAGAPAPKGLFGYVDDLNRDILEDLKRDYFDELDALQDTAAFAYEVGFRLELLLRGINPDRLDFHVQFAERRTETRNQQADLALKYQALGVAAETAWRTAGLDPQRVRLELERQREEVDPYPPSDDGGGSPRVSVTPGNERKGESATSITTRN